MDTLLYSWETSWVDSMGSLALVTLLIAVNECLAKSKVREKGFTLAHSLRMQSIMVRKAW